MVLAQDTWAETKVFFQMLHNLICQWPPGIIWYMIRTASSEQISPEKDGLYIEGNRQTPLLEDVPNRRYHS